MIMHRIMKKMLRATIGPLLSSMLTTVATAPRRAVQWPRN
jgi:hypothetical protein